MREPVKSIAAGCVLLSADPAIRSEVARASSTRLRSFVVASDATDLFAKIENAAPFAIVIDRAVDPHDVALHRALATRPQHHALVISVVRDATDVPRGADIVALHGALHDALGLADGTLAGPHRQLATEKLLAISTFSGRFDVVMASVGEQIAAAFGVDRCVLSLQGDSTGGTYSGDTWSSVSWTRTAQCCQAAVEAGTTFLAREDGACESYLATALQPGGFLALAASRPVLFTRDDELALQALASRLSGELGWRQMHERTVEELDRYASGPAFDGRLGIWNRPALVELAHTCASAARRNTQPFAVYVAEIANLPAINTRYGLDIGDRALRRIADAMRAVVRGHDIVGRWGPNKFAVLLQATALPDAQRAAERVQALLATRPLELPDGALVPLRTRSGVALLEGDEEPERMLQRAAAACKNAEEGGAALASASFTSPRISQQLEAVSPVVHSTLNGMYRLLHEISRGGMGVVYRGEDLALERPVAIKMLRPDLSEQHDLVEQLRKEAVLLARLQHPNLVQIYNFGQVGGDSYLVMELVEGEGLDAAIVRHRTEQTTMPLADALGVLVEVASALDALHERGIIHRDVKPANVIRDPFRNRSVLVDVGIARRFDQLIDAAGTPGFAAPEIIRGEPATTRSDVYGLAATAYVLFTLSNPWGTEEPTAMLMRQCSGELPPAPSAYRAELQPADAVILDALEVDPARRPESAGAFARKLRAALEPTLVPARDASRWVGATVLPKRAVVDKTRGVVFRAIPRAIGARNTERLRDSLGSTDPELVTAFTELAPLGWFPTDLLVRVIRAAAPQLNRSVEVLARDIGRTTVRASFRNFFPASSVTLVPERTLSATRNIWTRYHSWASITSTPVGRTESLIRLTGTLRAAELCAWTSGMLEQLVQLSGAPTVEVHHEQCELRGDDACTFRVCWTLDEPG